MRNNSIVEQLLAHRDEIASLGAARLALFGPAARGEDLPGSEIHLLVELDGVPTFERFLILRNFLTGLLGRPVELVLESPDHLQIWPYVQDDLVEILPSQ